ncbi:MAG: gamma-glutamyltransferase family protein, partial [Phycisphaerae bacterium]
RAIQREGVEWFYRGEFARKVEEAMRADGGIMTAADLAGYRAVEREAVTSTYRGYTVIGMPPPSSGGVHVAQILNVLENFDVRGMGEADRAHLLAEAMKLAFADRAYWLGDSDFVRVPKGLVDKGYAKELSSQIDLKRAGTVKGHGSPPGDEVFGGEKNRDDAKRLRAGLDAVGKGAAVAGDWEKHTTHIAAADAAGNVVAITQTINTAYGSKWVVPGTGVLMNNEMDDFSIAPGTPNAFGLVGAEANAVAAGKRPLSSMSPTIVLKDGRPVMTVGAAGGPRIITAVVQAIVNRVDLGMGVGAALAAPRVHQQWRPGVVYVEKAVPAGVVEELKRRGHEVEVSGGLGVAQWIVWEEGKLIGAHDPRAGGKAAGR